jgi:hypothetical protein
LEVLVQRFPHARVDYIRYLIQSTNFDIVNKVTEKLLSDASKKGYPKRLTFQTLTKVDMFKSPAYIKGVRHRLYNSFPLHFKSTIRIIMAEVNNNYRSALDKLKEVPTPTWWLPFFEKRAYHHIPEMDDPEVLLDLEEMKQYEFLKYTANDSAIAEELNRKQYKDEQQMLQCGCCFDDEVVFEDAAQCEDGHIFCRRCVAGLVKEGVFGQGHLRGKAVQCMHQNGCDALFTIEELKRSLPIDVFQAYERLYIERELERTGMEFHQCPFCKYAGNYYLW